MTSNNSKSVLIKKSPTTSAELFLITYVLTSLSPHTKLCCCTIPSSFEQRKVLLCYRKRGVTVQTLLPVTLMILDLGQSNSGTATLFEAIPTWVYLHQYMPSRECFKPLKATRFETLPKLYICSKRPRGTFASVIASSGSSSIHQGILQTSKYAQWVQATFQFLQGCFTGMEIESLLYSTLISIQVGIT